MKKERSMLKRLLPVCALALFLVACDDTSSSGSSGKDLPGIVDVPEDSVDTKDSTAAKDTLLPVDGQEAKDSASTVDTLDVRDTVPAVDSLETKDSIPPADTLEAKDTVSAADTLETKDTVAVVVPLCGGREYDAAKDTCYGDVIVPSKPLSTADCVGIPEYPYFDAKTRKCVAIDPELQPCPEGLDTLQDQPIEITPIDSGKSEEPVTPVDTVVPADTIAPVDTIVPVDTVAPVDSITPIDSVPFDAPAPDYAPELELVVEMTPRFMAATLVAASSADECAAGTFFDSGSSSCVSCPTGKYQNLAGQSSCKTCPTGTYQSM